MGKRADGKPITPYHGSWAEVISRRNPEAKALADRRYHHRIIKSKKLYNRKRNKTV